METDSRRLQVSSWIGVESAFIRLLVRVEYDKDGRSENANAAVSMSYLSGSNMLLINFEEMSRPK